MPFTIGGDTLANIATGLQETIVDRLVLGYNRINRLLETSIIIDGEGKNHQWDIAGDAAVGGAFPEGAIWGATDGGVDTTNKAYLAWGNYGGVIKVTDNQLRAIASTKEPRSFTGAVSKILGLRVDQLIAKMCQSINTDMLYGSGTSTSPFASGGTCPGIVGFLSAASSADGHDVGALSAYSSAATYAGLAKTNAFMRGNLVSQKQTGGVGVALTTAQLDGIIQGIASACGQMPTDIYISKGVATKFREIFQSGTNNIRIMSDQGGKYEIGSDPRQLEFQGIPVHVDYNISETALLDGGTTPILGQVYCINRNYARLVCLPSVNVDGGQPSSEQVSGLSLATDDRTSIPLDIEVTPLAKTGDFWQWQVKTVLAYEINPFFHGGIYNAAI